MQVSSHNKREFICHIIQKVVQIEADNLYVKFKYFSPYSHLKTISIIVALRDAGFCGWQTIFHRDKFTI
jgi:septum formation topological specificity factor MinE